MHWRLGPALSRVRSRGTPAVCDTWLLSIAFEYHQAACFGFADCVVHIPPELAAQSRATQSGGPWVTMRLFAEPGDDVDTLESLTAAAILDQIAQTLAIPSLAVETTRLRFVPHGRRSDGSPSVQRHDIDVQFPVQLTETLIFSDTDVVATPELLCSPGDFHVSVAGLPASSARVSLASSDTSSSAASSGAAAASSGAVDHVAAAPVAARGLRYAVQFSGGKPWTDRDEPPWTHEEHPHVKNSFEALTQDRTDFNTCAYADEWEEFTDAQGVRQRLSRWIQCDLQLPASASTPARVTRVLVAPANDRSLKCTNGCVLERLELPDSHADADADHASTAPSAAVAAAGSRARPSGHAAGRWIHVLDIQGTRKRHLTAFDVPREHQIANSWRLRRADRRNVIVSLLIFE